MRFFSKKPSAAEKAQSGETTPVASAVPSVLDEEKRGSDDGAAPGTALANEEKTFQAIAADRTSETEKAAASSGDEDDDEEDTTVYPKSTQLILITIALCLSVFCVALDNTIISTAIPKITDDFHAVTDVGWYGSAYLLTTCAFQLFFGKLYTFFSVKYVYLVAILIFEVGSAVCGAAPNSTALIVGRAVAGLGAAGVFSGAILIIANTVPLVRRPTYMGLVGGMYGIASVAGPLMGGAFTTDVTWRWCFYINLPIGGVTMLFIFIFYRPSADARAQSLGTDWRSIVNQLDLLGLVIFVPMIVCLLLALQWGGSMYPWSNGRIIALFVVFGVLLIVFVAEQFWKGDNATVPPRIMKQRSIAAGAIFTVCLGGAFFVFVYYIPIWFQSIKGVSPVESGIRNIPMVLSVVVMSIVGGVLTTALGYYAPFYIISSVLMGIGAGLLATFDRSTSEGKWIGYQIIFGFGVGAGMQQSLVMAQTVLKKRDVPIGTAVMMFFQLLGGALFLSVAQNVFSNGLISHLKKTAPEVSPAYVLQLGATALNGHIKPASLSGVLSAYNEAIVNTFYVGTAMAALSILGAVFIEWKSVKGKKIEMGGGA